ncbi:hypothetical protein ACUN9Y_00710 [Halomonas sp. V046]|uniref:hypothetical protein n=1 Tax=Halomonas sp. V046 TaxID=3459611 RepID=UPI0040441A42
MTEDERRYRLLTAQLALAEEADQSVVLLVAGHAGTGKGELINRLNHWLENRLTEVHALVPGDAERCRPYWWRYWRRLPAKGRMGIFVHGWVGDALMARAERRLGDGAWRDRLAEICAFEAELAADGVRLIKLWLEIDADVQRDHLEALSRDPATRWQVSDDKWRRHSQHGVIDRLARELRHHTDSVASPWVCLGGDPGRDLLTPVADGLIALLEGRKASVASFQELPATAASCGVSRPVTPRSTKAPSLPRSRPTAKRLKKAEYRQRLADAQARLAGLARAAVHQGIPLVVVFEGHDAAGKGGSIHRLTSALDARVYRVHQIAAPSDEEARYPWQWRFWQRLPRDGRVAVFDRSWYGRVLVERVEAFAAESDWRRGYAEIRHFEGGLLAHGAVVVKLFLAIDKDEQLKRFESRAETPYKRHKLTDEDWRNRERWDDYREAIDEMFAQTHTDAAEWTLIDANDKRRARLMVLEEISRRLAARLPLS